jgi:hypothetical protein
VGGAEVVGHPSPWSGCDVSRETGHPRPPEACEQGITPRPAGGVTAGAVEPAGEAGRRGPDGTPVESAASVMPAVMEGVLVVVIDSVVPGVGGPGVELPILHPGSVEAYSCRSTVAASGVEGGGMDDVAMSAESRTGMRDAGASTGRPVLRRVPRSDDAKRGHCRRRRLTTDDIAPACSPTRGPNSSDRSMSGSVRASSSRPTPRRTWLWSTKCCHGAGATARRSISLTDVSRETEGAPGAGSSPLTDAAAAPALSSAARPGHPTGSPPSDGDGPGQPTPGSNDSPSAVTSLLPSAAPGRRPSSRWVVPPR